MHPDYKQPSFYHFDEDSTSLAKIASKEYPNAKKVLDLCAGSGVVGLEYCLNNNVKIIHFNELQVQFEEILLSNIELVNSVESKVIIDDFRKASLESYDLILCNPPYFKKGDGRVSSDSQKQVCRTFETGSSVELIQTILKSLNPGGMGVIVYPYNLNHWKECKEKFKENIKVLQRSGKVEFSLIIKSDLN